MSMESRQRDIMILETMRSMVYDMSSTIYEQELIDIIDKWIDFLKYPILKGEKEIEEVNSDVNI